MAHGQVFLGVPKSFQKMEQIFYLFKKNVRLFHDKKTNKFK